MHSIIWGVMNEYILFSYDLGTHTAAAGPVIFLYGSMGDKYLILSITVDSESYFKVN